MGSVADRTGPGAFDAEQATAYAAAMDIETDFLHDQVFLELLRRHARGAALDLGGGTGRYAAWLLHTGLATSMHVIDNNPSMIDARSARALPGLSAQLGDIERADLGRAQYDTALARFALMHVSALDSTLQRIALSLNNNGTLVAVTNVIEGTAIVLTAFLGATSRVMKLVVRLKGHPIPVLNYARTQGEYVTAFRQAGLRIEFAETYEPKILHFENEQPGVTLSHFVLMGKKADKVPSTRGV